MCTYRRCATPILAMIVVASLAVLTFSENAVMAGGGKTVTVMERDDGSKIKLNQGDTLVVRLVAQPGTAYSWSIAKNDADLLRQQGRMEIEKPDKPAPGSKVTQIYRFRAEAAGTSTLELNYARPFDKDKAPGKTFKLTIEGQ